MCGFFQFLQEKAFKNCCVLFAFAYELWNTSDATRGALEDETETLAVPLPAVVCVTSDINLPRIAGMKQILAAGKKPQTVVGADAISFAAEPTIDVLQTVAPQLGARRGDIVEGDSPDAIAQFVGKLKEML